jgi:two-component system, NarL family, sensor histidine kinase UhpB
VLVSDAVAAQLPLDNPPPAARDGPPLAASLFWRVLILNAALMSVGAIALAASPVTVSFPATGRQVLVLALGVIALVAANAVLLRVSLRPLRELSALMERVDLLHPGQRLDPGGAREVSVLAKSFNDMLERLERERRTSSHRAVGGHEEERRRIATDLHDQIGQSLTALLLKLHTATEGASDDVRRDLVDAQAFARDALEEMRRIVRQLRPAALDDLGLEYALLSLGNAIEQTAGLVVIRRIELDLPALPPDVELALYRIAQEALTNVSRHAQATYAEIVLRSVSDRINLRVSDDGRGILGAMDVDGGIRGMRERALLIGAHLTIRSRPGGGTTVDVTAPLNV